MKKVIAISFTVIILVMGFLAFLPTTKSEAYLRIHIRANSNSQSDQEVKYEIKNVVVEYLTPLIQNANNLNQAENILNDNLQNISILATELLRSRGFNYNANAKLTTEYFPTRSYNDFVLNGGYYDALIIELGEANGDNWWCVVYPPICFLNSGAGNVNYKSIIASLINKE